MSSPIRMMAKASRLPTIKSRPVVTALAKRYLSTSRTSSYHYDFSHNAWYITELYNIEIKERHDKMHASAQKWKEANRAAAVVLKDQSDPQSAVVRMDARPIQSAVMKLEKKGNNSTALMV